MVKCHQATSHSVNQLKPTSMWQNGITKVKVKLMRCRVKKIKRKTNSSLCLLKPWLQTSVINNRKVETLNAFAATESIGLEFVIVTAFNNGGDECIMLFHFIEIYVLQFHWNFVLYTHLSIHDVMTEIFYADTTDSQYIMVQYNTVSHTAQRLQR